PRRPRPLTLVGGVRRTPTVQRGVMVLLIHPHHPPPWDPLFGQPAQRLRGRRRVVGAGGRHHHGQQQPQRVHDDVPLAALHLLVGVVAARLAALRGRDRLAGEAPGRRGPPPARPLADLLPQRVATPRQRRG